MLSLQSLCYWWKRHFGVFLYVGVTSEMVKVFIWFEFGMCRAWSVFIQEYVGWLHWIRCYARLHGDWIGIESVGGRPTKVWFLTDLRPTSRTGGRMKADTSPNARHHLPTPAKPGSTPTFSRQSTEKKKWFTQHHKPTKWYRNNTKLTPISPSNLWVLLV